MPLGQEPTLAIPPPPPTIHPKNLVPLLISMCVLNQDQPNPADHLLPLQPEFTHFGPKLSYILLFKAWISIIWTDKDESPFQNKYNGSEAQKNAAKMHKKYWTASVFLNILPSLFSGGIRRKNNQFEIKAVNQAGNLSIRGWTLLASGNLWLWVAKKEQMIPSQNSAPVMSKRFTRRTLKVFLKMQVWFHSYIKHFICGFWASLQQ